MGWDLLFEVGLMCHGCGYCWQRNASFRCCGKRATGGGAVEILVVVVGIVLIAGVATVGGIVTVVLGLGGTG